MCKKPFAQSEKGYYLFVPRLSIEGGVRDGGKRETRKMIGPGGHAMPADVTRNELSRESFVVSPKEYAVAGVTPGDKVTMDRRAAPAYERANGDSPGGRRQVLDVLLVNDYYRMSRSLKRIAREPMWDRAGGSAERGHASNSRNDPSDFIGGGISLHREGPPRDRMSPYEASVLGRDAHDNAEPYIRNIHELDPVSLMAGAGFEDGNYIEEYIKSLH